MRGYKAMNYDYSSRFGDTYEIGKTYTKEGQIIYQKNGFHFCVNPEDTLRYFNGFNDFRMALVNGEGDLYERIDEEYEFYGCYVCRTLTFIREIPREELFNIIINSNEIRVKRFVTLSELSEEEKEEVLYRYPNLKEIIDYYQNKEFVLKRKLDI